MNNKFEWRKYRVLITGGASFIGSHLVDALIQNGAKIVVIDDLSSGKIENISEHIKKKRLEFIKADLRRYKPFNQVLKNVDIIFHLAADHGGRGYVDLHQASPASNLFLDGLVFWEAYKAGVKKIVYASSGCVYPNYLQQDIKNKLYLKEGMVKPPYDADNMYGWAKLMGELTLKAYTKEYGMKTVSCRYFSVFGPRGIENHAITALIARAFIKQNPFEVWGDGNQVRNWTYVEDIVRGTILAAEKINDGSAINLGTSERIRVIDAVNEIFKYLNFKRRIKFLKNMPVGPLNRVADNSLAKKLLNWEPQVTFKQGLRHTIDWYFTTKDVNYIADSLDSKLVSR